jgi:cysteine-rich repeat protein
MGGDPETAVCGDGYRAGDEQCDDGNTSSGDGCDAACHVEPSSSPCGDGVIEGAEECDDANLQVGDGCDARCRTEGCGNGRMDAGEECDPPKSGSCTAHCKLESAHCGDGKVQADEGEQCDDGNDESGDGCTDCRVECGDGTIDASIGEECEPEYSDHCGDNCRWLPTCGDGEVQAEAGEECDPSNGTTCVDCKRASACDGGDGGCGGQAGCVPVAQPDLMQNGTFDTDASGWLPQSSLVTASVVNDGSPKPDALEVTFASGPIRAVAGAYQCVPVRAGHHYELEAKYRIPASAPDGVSATVTTLLYAGTRCEGQVVDTVSGSVGSVRNAWTPYQVAIDTTALTPGSEGRLYVRLGVVRPENVDGGAVIWDSVSLPPGPLDVGCGNCVVDAGETCDDGNLQSGDGCSSGCQLERCGDGTKSSTEECDDGNSVYAAGDQCTAACRTPTGCDTCAADQCASRLADCMELEGVAAEGPRAGTARSTLCDALLTCVRTSACDLAQRQTLGVNGAFIENCYCGTSGDDCFSVPGAANGTCRAQTEAAIETTSPSTVAARLDGSAEEYPVFAAAKRLLDCETTSCASTCARAPACGDGTLEDRNLDYTFNIGGKEVPCADALTATGHGCSREECDDGNTTDGDGCDHNCFVEECGNNVIQTGEECDDGNQVSGDGCSADCVAEYVCGNGEVTTPFEQCDRGADTRQSDGAWPGLDCSTDQAASTPDACACDNRCQLVVCGDGLIQRPYEQCEPPGNGTNCDDACQIIAQNQCVGCIENGADGSFQADNCDRDPKCVAVENCVIEAQCFSPLPGFCYCGTTDINGACSKASFAPSGPCVDEIKAGEGPQPDNATYLQGFFDPGNSTGIAMLILGDLPTNAPECVAACYGTQGQ